MHKVVKLVIFCPETHGDAIRQALGDSGAGVIGLYDYCSFTIKGVGRFKPMEGAQPFIGEVGKFEAVQEERIETPVEREKLPQVLAAVKKAHPYEEPVIEVYELVEV